MRRNGDATGVLATACAERGVDLVAISTNEVFDGARTDGVGYAPDDPTSPAEPVRRLEARRRARRDRGVRRRRRRPRAGAWASSGRRGCSGRPAATSRARSSRRPIGPRAAGEPLRVVGDEWGTPTYAADVADAIVELLAEDAHAGIHHLVNGLFATRALWAEYIVGRFALAGRRSSTSRRTTWARASTPPRWGVLDADTAAVGRADAAVARRDGRLRAGPRARVAARRGRPMSLERAPSALPGVRYGAVARLGDQRGSFRELWRASAFGAIDPADAGAPGRRPTFVQANLSDLGGRGPARPAPPPPPARLLDRGVSGRAFVALVDVRPMLAGRARRPPSRRASSAADDWVVIPTGVAHGFLALEPLELLYLVTNEYDGTDELGFAWDDPAAACPGRRPGHARRPPDPVRSRPLEPVAGRPRWCACAHTAA